MSPGAGYAHMFRGIAPAAQLFKLQACATGEDYGTLEDVKMRIPIGQVAASFLVLALAVLSPVGAQSPRRGAGGFVPGQQRAPADPAQIARGKTLYGISCTGCHGADLRGGDLGGPNLLRSQVALSDLNGELIVPIIQGSRKS